MAKKSSGGKMKWYNYLQVGVKLALIGIVGMIAAWLIMIPIGIILGIMSVAAGTLIAGAALITVINMAIGFLVMGYLVVKWRTWLYKKSWV